MLTEIWTRQSIRRYEDRTVEKEKLEELLRAAMHAPTARNTQSWRFMVIRNRKALDEMTTLQPYTGMMKTAPCAILVMGDQKATDLDEYLQCRNPKHPDRSTASGTVNLLVCRGTAKGAHR